MMNAASPRFRALRQPRSNDRLAAVERAERAAGGAVPVRAVDLRGPLPDLPGGSATRVWLVLHVGGLDIGRLLLGVPEEGLCSAQVGAAVAARLGTGRRGPARGDGQDRSRSRGRISSL